MPASRIPDIRDQTEHAAAAAILATQIASIVSFTLAGCAVPTTGIVPRGDELLTVARQGNGFWVTTDSLKVEALKDAAAYCDKIDRKLKVIHTKETPAGSFGRWPESEVLFRCE